MIFRQLLPAIFALFAVFAAPSVSGQLPQPLPLPLVPEYRQMTASGRGIYMDGERISCAAAIRFAKSDAPGALKYLRSGRVAGGFAIGMYALGGAIAGWGIETMIDPYSDMWVGSSLFLVGAGAVVVAGALGIKAIAVGRYRKAAQVYNDAVLAGFADRRPVGGALLSLAGTRGGLGLQLTF